MYIIVTRGQYIDFPGHFEIQDFQEDGTVPARESGNQ